MNCVTCKNQVEAYLEGELSQGAGIQMEDHLSSCKECAALYRTMLLVNRITAEEKNVEPNPFLATRILARIEGLEEVRSKRPNPFAQKVLKPVLISVSIAVAVFFGVLTGGIYQTDSIRGQVPVELSYLNDASMESVEFYANN